MTDKEAREAAARSRANLIRERYGLMPMRDNEFVSYLEDRPEEVEEIHAAIDAYLAKMREQMPDPADMYPDIPADPDHFPTGWSRAEERDAYRLGFTDGRVTLSAQQPDHSALIAEAREYVATAGTMIVFHGVVKTPDAVLIERLIDALEGKTNA